MPGDTGYTEPRVFTFVEQNPKFPGGDKALIKFLQDHIVYPDFDRVLVIEGKVLVRFVVMEDGSVGDVVISKGVSPGLDNESKRVVRMMPKFTPGTQQGKPVRVYFNLPVVYRLTGGNEFLDGINNLAKISPEFNKGLTAMRDHDFEVAISIFSKLAKKERDGNIYELLWVCYKEVGDQSAMCAALQKAIKAGHHEQDAQHRLCK